MLDTLQRVTNLLILGLFGPFQRVSHKKNTPTLLLMCSLKLGAFLPLYLCYDIILYIIVIKVENPLDLFF